MRSLGNSPGMKLAASCPAFLRLCYTSAMFERATPAAQQLQNQVHEAISTQTPLEPVGGCTQLHVGFESSKPLREVSLADLTGIIDYAPEDLVIVAEAGMTMTQLQGTLKTSGQVLPLEVALPDRQTLGGVVVTRANSLIRGDSGSVRDWLIGCQVIGGDGQIIAGGGKVVKNVAGYDLPKLYCGSWGTLGIITQVAFKVAPLRPSSSTLLVTLDAKRNAEDALDAIHRHMTPSFSYLLNPSAARAVLGDGVPDAQCLAIGFDGQPEAVEALTKQVIALVEPFAFQIIALPDAVAAKFRANLRDLPLHVAPLTARFNILPSQVGAFARMLEWIANRGGIESAQVFADTGAGIVWAHIYAPVQLKHRSR